MIDFEHLFFMIFNALDIEHFAFKVLSSRNVLGNCFFFFLGFFAKCNLFLYMLVYQKSLKKPWCSSRLTTSEFFLWVCPKKCIQYCKSQTVYHLEENINLNRKFKWINRILWFHWWKLVLDHRLCREIKKKNSKVTLFFILNKKWSNFSEFSSRKIKPIRRQKLRIFNI